MENTDQLIADWRRRCRQDGDCDALAEHLKQMPAHIARALITETPATRTGLRALLKASVDWRLRDSIESWLTPVLRRARAWVWVLENEETLAAHERRMLLRVAKRFYPAPKHVVVAIETLAAVSDHTVRNAAETVYGQLVAREPRPPRRQHRRRHPKRRR